VFQANGRAPVNKKEEVKEKSEIIDLEYGKSLAISILIV
jgi:hypothetical protein